MRIKDIKHVSIHIENKIGAVILKLLLQFFTYTYQNG